AERAGGPLDEPNRELALEVGEPSADRRRRDPEPRSRLVETAEVHDRHEGLGGEQVHLATVAPILSLVQDWSPFGWIVIPNERRNLVCMTHSSMVPPPRLLLLATVVAACGG